MLISINLAEPQRCFCIDGYRFCNWVRRGNEQALLRDDGGYLRFPAGHKKKKSETEEDKSKQKEKAPVVEN